jgi:hypothetical protein
MPLLASQYDQSRYFKAADLTAEKKLKIKSVTEELIGMDNDKEKKLVVWFTNDARGLALNRVNNRTIRGAFGDAVEGWTDKIIILFPTTAEFRGKMCPAIRVRIPPPKQAAAAVSPSGTSPSGNGAAVKADPVDEQQQAKPPADDLNDELPW